MTEQDNTETPDEGTSHLPTDDRPLGYWLRVVDGLITSEFLNAFEAEGLSRRDWMLLNVVDRTVDAPELAQRLARRGGKRLHELEDRGWIARTDDGGWTLTETGRVEKERLGGIVDGLRTKVAGAVSPEDFVTLTASLRAIARELGYDESNPKPGKGRGFGRGLGRGRGFGHGFDRAGFGDDRGFGFGLRRGFGPDFGHEGREGHACSDAHDDNHGHGRFGRDCFGEWGNPRHGHPQHDHPQHGHRGGHHGDRRKGERAYERGFEAGFAAAQRATSPDARPAAETDSAAG